MPKYPTELHNEAIKWFGLPTDKDDTIEVIANRIFAMRKTIGKGLKGLEYYSSLEIAEMIKDIDRHA